LDKPFADDYSASQQRGVPASRRKKVKLSNNPRASLAVGWLAGCWLVPGLDFYGGGGGQIAGCGGAAHTLFPLYFPPFKHATYTGLFFFLSLLSSEV